MKSIVSMVISGILTLNPLAMVDFDNTTGYSLNNENITIHCQEHGEHTISVNSVKSITEFDEGMEVITLDGNCYWFEK